MIDTPTPVPSASPIRFGILGCGRVAHTHVDAIRALGDRAALVAVCDSDPEALGVFTGKTGAAGFSSLEDMVALAELDVVSICTPSGVHAQNAVVAAAAGKHVLVEKPLDVTAEAVEQMISACDQHGVQLFPVFQNRFNPTVQLVKEALDAGRFGRLLAVNSTVIWKREQSYYDSAAWRGTRAMDGGAFMNQGIHFVDMMRYLGGEVTEVHAMIGTQARDIECEDTGSALFRFENGALGNIFVTMTGPGDLEGSVTLIGESGLVKIGGVAMNRIDTWQFDTPDPEQDDKARHAEIAIRSVYGEGHQAVYHHAAAHLQEHTPFPITAEDAVRSVGLIQKIYSGMDHVLASLTPVFD